MSKFLSYLYVTVIAVVVVALNYAMMRSSVASAQQVSSAYIGGGDCSADRATGDLYLNPDPYCLSARPAAQPAVEKDEEPTITLTVDEPETPVITEETPVVIDDGGVDLPTEVDQPAGDQPKDDKPGDSCKNKNSGKDGTPAECNAGKGQEKH